MGCERNNSVMSAQKRIEFYQTIVEHHVHENEWCPVRSCQEYIKLTGQLPFVIVNWQGDDKLQIRPKHYFSLQKSKRGKGKKKESLSEGKEAKI